MAIDKTLLHAYGPWVLIVLGVVSLVQVTVFYDAALRWGRRLREWLQQAGPSQPGWASRMHDLQWRLVQSPAYRWLTVFMSITWIAGGVAWLALRP
jgi:hypothetical protein